MALFRKSGEPHALSIAMTGVRLGDRLLQIGCGDPTRLGAIGSKVGLSGRACAAASSADMAARARRGAERAGVLVEIEQTDFAKLPFADASFDLVVIDSTDGMLGSMSPGDRNTCLREAWRVLVGRGRIVVIESEPRPGLAGLWRRAPVSPSDRASGGSLGALTGASFRAVRTLAERGGLSFLEGTK
jgi:demethylmenaquinone methyltransferase/2-methoxy-6-polyprenyl-1,4-benzoquinol methylase